MRTKKFCTECDAEIPEGRIKALPDTEVCVNCSDTEKKLGFRVITGKSTYTELEIVDNKEKLDKLKRYERTGNHAFHIKDFVKKDEQTF